MKMRIATSVAAIAVAATPLVTSVASSTPDPVGAKTTQSRADKPKGLTPTWKTFNTTIGRGTKIVVSTGGNITSYLSPNIPTAQYEHIGVGAVGEGYVLCYSGLSGSAFDLGQSQSGFAAPTTSGTQVKRKTSDGRMQLTQSFTFSPGSNNGGTTLNIGMSVKNLTGSTINNVILRRQVDFDIDTGGAQGWAGFQSNHARTKAAVIAFHDPSEAPANREAHGIMLSNSNGVSAVFTTLVTANILDSACSPAPAPQSPEFFVSRGDFGDSISYDIGNLAPGATKTVGIRYQRI
ncbi:MAG: hypothetical protein ABI890_01010 [Lapillicoccus sp.]